ncbi:hypothetical protein E1286_46625 [Nonomuraea terrae]|uniref:Uncharacterized protein n=1 Tax=Nonomuraea terrae TaxID=2530383 RepID=A0A4R4XF55_9ACTN|nr:hypothetical protein [Nonomuraea terrae]TDD29082.1 hypothetical protein E1286_46625 [Nonomuraea terrae]
MRSDDLTRTCSADIPGRGWSPAIRFVREARYRRLVTFHHQGNTVAIAMNRRPGLTGLES